MLRPADDVRVRGNVQEHVRPRVQAAQHKRPIPSGSGGGGGQNKRSARVMGVRGRGDRVPQHIMHTRTCARIHIRALQAHKYTRKHACTHTRIHMHAHTHTHACMHTCTHIYSHPMVPSKGNNSDNNRLHTCAHTCTPSRAPTHAQTHKHAQMHNTLTASARKQGFDKYAWWNPDVAASCSLPQKHQSTEFGHVKLNPIQAQIGCMNMVQTCGRGRAGGTYHGKIAMSAMV